ncbi:hypothetical protein F6B41_20035 [Microbacterium lushaniae]|nr:hypothetical protein F6B41_23270 [Microbacterium lushaniae]KAA9151605.1 hypothetical protein F6B41_20035 [Microbacterium lushaniae]
MLRATRVVAVVILPFLVVAAFLLYVFPDRTGELFAWAIDPPLSAYLLASAYVGGIWFFVRVAVERRWHRVQHGFPAVAVFAGALLVATLLHLDRFSPNLSFAVWMTLYATTPFAVVVLAIIQRRHAQRGPDPVDVEVPRFAALGLAAIGAAAFAFGAVVFAAPGFAASFWAWELTPLTGRVTGAVLSLTGVVNVALLWDRRWSAFRILFQAQLLSLAAICLSLLLRSTDLRWERPMTAVFLVLVVGAVVAYGGFTAWCEREARRTRP